MLRRPLYFTMALAAFLWGGYVLPSFAEDPVYFTFVSDKIRYRFDGGFHVKADPQVIWDVLSDFDHYSRYISNMHCKVRGQDGDGLLVDQTLGGSFLFIEETIKTRLDIKMEPLTSITFSGIDHRAFDSYEGGWKILPQRQGGDIKVTYDLIVERNNKTPGFLTNDLFSGSQGDLLSQMQKEIIKRQAKLERDRMKGPVKEAHK